MQYSTKRRNSKMNYVIKTKTKECLPLDEWITKLEMRAFGWRYKGLDTTYFDEYDVNINWDAGTATATQRSRTDIVFKRIEPYSFNPVFVLLELMMSIQSWIRRKLIFLFFGLCALGLIIGVLTQDMTALGAVAGIAAFVYVPSIFYAILGFLFRKVFGLDRNLKKRLVKNKKI